MPSSNNTLSVFSYIGQDVRTVQVNGEPWFVAADVLAILALDRTANRRLDDDEMGVASIHTLGGEQTLSIVSEPGLYSLILGSRKVEAREFKRFITHVVLPEIRQTGSFAAVVETPEQLLARALIMANDTLTAKNEQIAELEPKAGAWDALASAKGDYSVGDAAKMLARAGIPTGPTRLFGQLADLKWTFRNSDGAWRAYAERVEKGYLAEKPSFHYHPKTGERVVDPPQVRVTIKGLERLRQRLHVGALTAVTA
jgi:anti-repressor protein